MSDPAELVLAALHRRSRRYRIEDPGQVVLESGLGENLHDLGQAVQRRLREGRPPELVADQVVAEMLGRERRYLQRRALAQENIRLRVTHPEQLPAGGTLPGPADLIVHPVHDTVDASIRLDTDQVRQLGGLEQVCLGAWDATLAEPVSHEIFDLEGRFITVLVGGGIYTASRVLDMRRLLSEVGLLPDGETLVGVPCAREVLLVPVLSNDLDDLVAAVGPLVSDAYAESPGQVSPTLYRWSSGKLDRLPPTSAS